MSETLFDIAMKAQPVRLDAEEAAAQRDAAVDAVDAGGPARWKRLALEAVYRVCLKRSDFIVDDVWIELGLDEKPVESRVMGAVIKSATKQGWCEATDVYRPSAQPQCHSNPRRVWRSRLR